MMTYVRWVKAMRRGCVFKHEDPTIVTSPLDRCGHPEHAKVTEAGKHVCTYSGCPTNK
jgi:hypothetical protein